MEVDSMLTEEEQQEQIAVQGAENRVQHLSEVGWSWIEAFDKVRSEVSDDDVMGQVGATWIDHIDGSMGTTEEMEEFRNHIENTVGDQR